MRCKFKLSSITRTIQQINVKQDDGSYKTVDREMWSIAMSPVYANRDPNHENSKFWDASPGGEFKLNTVNKDAVDSLKLGAEYYFDITEA